MSDRVAPADRRLRWWSLLAVCVAAALGVVVLVAVRNALLEIHVQHEQGVPVELERAVRLIRALAVAGSAGALGSALWFWLLGTRILRCGAYPPPGMKVIKETRVKEGDAARRVALGAFLLSVVLTAVGTGGMWLLYQLALDALR